MFCPECRSEFEAWVSVCPDCDVPLVPELPAEPKHEAPELRRVLATSDPDVLPVVTSALRAADIPFWTSGETSVGLWPLGSGGGQIPSNLVTAGVFVPAEHYEEALAVLETVALPLEDRSDPDDSDPK
jgi:hypothetical protein